MAPQSREPTKRSHKMKPSNPDISWEMLKQVRSKWERERNRSFIIYLPFPSLTYLRGLTWALCLSFLGLVSNFVASRIEIFPIAYSFPASLASLDRLSGLYGFDGSFPGCFDGSLNGFLDGISGLSGFLSGLPSISGLSSSSFPYPYCSSFYAAIEILLFWSVLCSWCCVLWFCSGFVQFGW